MGQPAEDYAADRVPAFGNNRRFWTTMAAVFLSLVVLGEVWARSMGVTPMPNDTPGSWALTREDVQPEDVVIIGTSRGQRAIDPAVLQRYTDLRVVSLARTSTGVLPIVRHMAEDETFVGTLIIDIHPNHWQYAGERLTGNINAAGLLAAHRNRASSLPAEAWLARQLQRRVAIFSPEFDPIGIVRALVGMRPSPGHNHLRFTERRFVEFVPEHFDEARHDRIQARKNQRLAEMPVAQAQGIADAAAELLEPVETLRQRGVRVVFVRTPSSKFSRERENHRVPRELVYDTLAETVGGEWFHFEDAVFDPELNCPDGSHLDTPSAHVFTAWLAETVFGNE